MKHHIAAAATMLAMVMPALAEEGEQATGEQMESATEQQAAPATAPAGTVARSAFTSGIEDREPIDEVGSLESTQNRIYYFTEIRDMSGQTVTHRWEHNGQVMAEVPFEIGGDRWRVYSSKSLEPSWTGEWKASVVDGSGATLSANTFTYTEAEAAPAAPAATPETETQQ